MKKTCLYCGKEFECHTRKKCCCYKHLEAYKNRKRFPDGSDYVECKVCGFRALDLHKHITKVHHMKIENYCQQFSINEIDLQTELFRKHNSEMQKLAHKEGRLKGWPTGDANPSCRKEVKDGRKSIFSENYVGYDGLTTEEKKTKIASLLKSLAERKKQRKTNPLTFDYYLSKGFSEVEAKEKLKERQSTFSLQKCIEKYGAEEGEHVFRERQKKWQNTLNSKPIEEIERINKAKLLNGKGWSTISQKLFNSIMCQLNGIFNEVFYATNNPEKKENNEYMVFDKNTGEKFFLDFYIKDNNKVIEFDGDYWYGEKRGNQKRDKEREEKLKTLGFVNILHIRERDYKADPDKVIQECLQFIRK